MWTLVSCGQLIRIKRTAKEYVTESILGSRGMHLQSIKFPARKIGVTRSGLVHTEVCTVGNESEPTITRQ